MRPLANFLAKKIVFTLKDGVREDQAGGLDGLDKTVLSVLGKWIEKEELPKQSKPNDDENEKSTEGKEDVKEAQDEEAKQALVVLQDLERKSSWAGELPKEVASHPLYVALQGFEEYVGQGRELLDRVSKCSIARLEETIGEEVLKLSKSYMDLCSANQILQKSKLDLTNNPGMQQLVTKVEVALTTGKILLACQSGEGKSGTGDQE